MVAPPIVEKSSFSPTILISGGAGFLGSHLARHLLKEKARVVLVDNFLTGKKSTITDLLKNPRLLFIEHDINKGLPKNITSVDYIIHLAGFETYTTGKTDVVLEALLTNSLGTKSLLDLAVKSEAKFLLASSLDIYQGVLSSFDLKHYFGPTNLEERRFSHLEAKRFAESLVWQYHKKHHLNARIARLPEIYGPGMGLDSCANLGRLLKELLQKETVTVFGEGLEREFYLHVDDAVRGMVKAMFAPETEGKIFSLSPAEGVTILELTYLLKSLTTPETTVLFKPALGTITLPETKIVGTETQRELGWKPKIPLEQGLKEALKWCGIKTETKKQISPRTDEKPTTTVAQSRQKKLDFKEWATRIPRLKIPTRWRRLWPVGLVGLLLLGVGTLGLRSRTDDRINQGYQSLENSYQHLAKFRFNPAARAAVQSQRSLEKIRQVGEQSSANTGVLNAAIYFNSALEHTATAAPLFLGVKITESLLELELALENLRLARAEINTEPTAGLTDPHLRIRNLIAEKSDGLQLTLEIVRALATDLPQLLGTTAPAHYRIVLRNHNEAPSDNEDEISFPYSVMTVENGEITSWSQKDVVGNELLGMITLDLKFIEQLLEKLGPVTVENEIVSASNLASRTIEHPDNDWQTLLIKSVLEKLLTLPISDLSELLPTIRAALDQQHLWLAPPPGQFAQTVAAQGWDGQSP